MVKIVIKATEEEFENLDSIGLFNMDNAGVFYQSITITSISDESKKCTESHKRDSHKEWWDSFYKGEVKPNE